MKTKTSLLLNLIVVFSLILPAWSSGASAAVPADEAPSPAGSKPPQPMCALLDSPTQRGLMSGMFEIKLLILCGRQEELGGGADVSGVPQAPASTLQADVQVNNSATDVGQSTTQSETTIRVNPNTGTICSAYNDSQHWAQGSIGFHGFSSSTDGGVTFADHGPFPAGGGGNGFGDPSLVWRAADGSFYYAALHSNGLGLWRSTDDCESFAFRSMIHVGTGDDKELMAVDNNPASPYYGRIYVAWTDFDTGSRIYVTYSDDGLAWSAPVAVSGVGVSVQGAWPAVDPVTGDVYVGWVRWNPYPTGPIDIEIVRSVNGGVAWGFVTNPLTGAVNPRDVAATASCDRPALNRDIRYLPSPQVAVDHNSNLHVVYSYDPDGYGTGDVVNVYYRRSTNQGTTWGPEILLNDDGTTTDQWFPTVSVGPTGVVVATWYDRRNDVANNRWFDYYKAFSYDNGVTWGPNIRVSDVSSDVPILNPNFDPIVATCYHGDYDQQVQDENFVYIQWSDDRNIQNGHPDPDIWFEKEPVEPGPGECYSILFDETHGWANESTVGDYTIEDGFVELAAFLEGHGHTVDSLQDPNPFDYATISQYDVLVLMLPQEYYSVGEKDAIAQFVEEGGRLVTIDEWGGFAGVSQDILNDVHAHLGDGLFHNYDEVYDPTDYEVNVYWPLIHVFSPDPVNDGVGTVVEYFGSSLQVSGPAHGTAFGDDDTYTQSSPMVAEGGAALPSGFEGSRPAPAVVVPASPPRPGVDRAAQDVYQGPLVPASPPVPTWPGPRWRGRGLPSGAVPASSRGPDKSGAKVTVPDLGQEPHLKPFSQTDSPVTAPPAANPEAVLYDNCPFITHPGGGSGGADASALQSALGMGTYGFGHQLSTGYRIADEFVITDPEGWTIDNIMFFAYQTGSPTDPSPITHVNYRIWDGDPSNPASSVVYGDTSTNRLVNTNWTNVYRVLDTDLLDTQRPVMEDLVDTGIWLGPGTYWLDWQTDGTLGSGPWANPCTILGQTTTGNGLQSLDNGVTWAAAIDSGTSTPQGFPFIMLGIVGQPPPEVIVQAMSSVGAGDVFAIGDANLWDSEDYDGDAILSLYEYDNAQLAWNVFAFGQVCNTPPDISGLPDVIIDHTTILPVQIDLWAYALDAETPDSGLTYTIEDTPPPDAGVLIVGNRWLTINPSSSWCGYTDVTVRVTDPGGLWDDDTLRVAVTWSCQG